jgi:hypothetical protein
MLIGRGIRRRSVLVWIRLEKDSDVTAAVLARRCFLKHTHVFFNTFKLERNIGELANAAVRGLIAPLECPFGGPDGFY